MSETHEPAAIREKMLAIVETCIRRKLREATGMRADAEVFKATGDMLHRAGCLEAASQWHNRTISFRNMASTDENVAKSLANAWGIDLEDLKTGTRWAPVLTHSGVGEGDSGLPFAELPASNAGRIPVLLNPGGDERQSPSATAENPRPKGGSEASPS